MSRSSPNFVLISSIVLPTSGHEALNTHAHSEQPQPLKIWLSIHTNLRRIGPLDDLNSKSLEITDGEGLLSVEYPTLAGIAISIKGAACQFEQSCGMGRPMLGQWT